MSKADSTIPVAAGHRRFAMQWRPNFIRSERRLVLTRIYWNRGTPGDGKGGHSCKLSLSVCFDWRDIWIGLYIKPELWGFILYFCLIPCLPIRIHLKRSYGGSFI